MRDVLFPLLKGEAARLALVAFAVLLAQQPGRAALTDLVSLGSADYAIDPSVSTGTYSQNTTGTTFSPSVVLADTVGGTFGPFDWSSFSDLNSHIYLKIAFTGSNPLLPMTLQLFNSDFSLSNLYQGTTTPVAAFPGYFIFDLTSAFTPAVLADAAGAQISWEGGATVNATLQAIASDPATPPPPPPQNEGFFIARTPGGVRFLTATDAVGVELPPGATSWQSLSDRNTKTNVTAVDPQEVLRKIANVPVTTWQYHHVPNRRYIGPMAQDFHAAFGLGYDDKHISTLDTDGVALAALQGLIEELRERKERSAEQARRLAELDAELRALSEQIRSHLPPGE
jgi:hypothetical protein